MYISQIEVCPLISMKKKRFKTNRVNLSRLKPFRRRLKKKEMLSRLGKLLLEDRPLLRIIF